MRTRAVVGVVAVAMIVAAGIGVAALLFPALSGGPPDVSTPSDTNLDDFSGVYPGDRTDPVGVVRVGDGAGGLPLLVWNDAGTDRTVLVRLSHEESGETLVDRRVTLPANGTYLVRILHSDRYALTVGSENGTERLRITEAAFGRDDQRTTIRIRENGTVESRTQWEEAATGEGRTQPHTGRSSKWPGLTGISVSSTPAGRSSALSGT